MLRKERTNVTNCNYHLVFVTKYRKEIFTNDEKRQYLKDVLLKLATNTNTEIEQIEVMKEHVHLLISFSPKYSISDIVKSLKGTSAREWFKKYPETKQLLWNGHLWTPSFYCGTVGDVSKNIVNEYIKNQMASVRTMSKLGHNPTYTKKPR